VKLHEKYIKRCIELAKNGLGTTYPNPMVGSVIVYEDQIIGEGWHKKAGEPHAEVMKKYNLLAVILLAVLFTVSCTSCKNENPTESFFSFNEDVLKAQYTPKESLKLEVLNPLNKKIDSIVYSINDKKVGAVKGGEKLSFDFKDQKLGYQNLKALVYFEGATEVDYFKS